MSGSQISALIPIRNRSGPRLENCLKSLRWQDYNPAEVDIIIADYGSSEEHLPNMRELAECYNAKIVRIEEHGVWNRSKALNHGIQHTTSKFVFCTDVDMIFAPNFVSTVLMTQARQNDQAFIICHNRDLPEHIEMKVWSLEDIPYLLGEANFRLTSGTGPCQVAHREFFERIRGFDEGYKFWGQEDNDMRYRAGSAGLREVWIHDQTAMLHQWHPSDRRKRPVRKSLNDLRFNLTKRITVKNWLGWGERRRLIGFG